jgi:D-alanine transfer protein
VNKFFVNIYAFFIALVVVISLLYVSKNEILNYYAKPLQDSLQKTISLQNDLESGKIVVFGSSELVINPNQKFLPQNYFNNDLKLPLRIQGNEGQQSFAILSQLAAYHGELIKENAKVVILLSPSWFTGSNNNGTTIPKFLEFMYPGMMNKLYFQSEIDDSYKILINNYVKNNISYIKNPNFIYEYSFNELEEDYLNNEIKKFLIKSFDNRDINPPIVTYKNPMLNYGSLKIEANKIATPSTNNSYGISDEYFTKHIEPSIKMGSFPYTIIVPSELDKNQEYQDLLVLLELLKSYKIKPLFVMQDLHPYVFAKNRDEMTNVIKTIKSKIQENNYGYLDMWSYKKEDYEIGTLTDIVHSGELGWVKINQKIIEHFITKEEK